MLSAGDLDTTFNPNGNVPSTPGIPGVLTGAFVAGENERVFAVATQSDGKIVVAGTTVDNPNEDVLVARFLDDGSIDTSFGGGDGFVQLDFSAGAQSLVNEMVIDSLGRILFVGQADGDFAVARLESDGTLDTDFGGDGTVLTQFLNVSGSAVTSVAKAVTVDTNGDVIVAGQMSNSGNTPSSLNTGNDFAVVRYDDSGAELLRTRTDIGGGNQNVWQVLLQSDGKIVVAGQSDPAGTDTNDFAAVRYNSNLTLDTGFDGDGIATASVVTTAQIPALVNSNDQVTDALLQADGKIVVVGSTEVAVGPAPVTITRDMAVVRFNSDGSVDTSLLSDPLRPSAPGTRRLDFSANDTEFAEAVIEQPDGKLIVVGRSNTSATAQRLALARLNADGTYDTTFGTAGKVLDDLDTVFDEPGPPVVTTTTIQPNDAALQSDGKLLAVGYAAASDAPGVSQFFVARYETGLLIADAGGPYTLNEPGGSVLLSGSAFGTGTFTFEWDLDGDNVFGEFGIDATNGNENEQNPTFIVSGVDNPTVFTVTLRVTNDNVPVEVDEDIATITILNVAPTLSISGDADVDEGATYVLGLSSFDPGDDTISQWTIDWGDGMEVVSGNPLTATHVYADGDANYVISATATDEDGTFAAGNDVDVMVHNVAPTVTADNAIVTVDEGETAANTGTFDDPGDDTVTLTASIGTVVDEGGGVWSWSYGTSDGPDDSQSVTITATDSDDDFSEVIFALVVSNVAPAIAADNGSVTVDEGETAANTGTFDDPGDDTVTLTASIGTVVDEGGGVWSWSYDTTDGPDDSQSVTITATDSDDDFSEVVFALVVNNVAPTADAGGDYVVNEGSTVVLSGSGTDVPGDTLTFEWDLDDNGSFETSGANPVFDATNLDGNVGSTFTVNLRVTDSDNDFSIDSATVTVLNVAPTADAGGPYLTFDDTAITLTGSGFDVPADVPDLFFEWDFDGDFDTVEAIGQNATFDPVALGITTTTTVTVSLRVSDGDGGVTIDTADVTVLSEGTLLIDGVLHVVGSNTEDDCVFIVKHNGAIKVYATFNDDNPVVFNAADVDEIQIRTRGGHDKVIVSHSVDLNTTIDGGSGNDALLGGSGDDLILGGSGDDMLAGQGGDDMLLAGSGRDDLFGGSGDDVLVAGDADDLLFGGSGRDLLIGGQDNDFLNGGSDDDILIGGVTIHDNDTAALDAVMAVWTSSDSFNDRVEELTGSGGLLEAGVAVFDDDDTDVLIGGAGRDLLFADVTWAGNDIDFILFNHIYDHLEVVN